MKKVNIKWLDSIFFFFVSFLFPIFFFVSKWRKYPPVFGFLPGLAGYAEDKT